MKKNRVANGVANRVVVSCVLTLVFLILISCAGPSSKVANEAGRSADAGHSGANDAASLVSDSSVDEWDGLTYQGQLKFYNQVLKSRRGPATSEEELTSADTLVLPADFEQGKLFTTIKEPSVLAELERKGFSFAHHLGAAGDDASYKSGAIVTNKTLYSSNGLYKSFADLLSADVAEVFKHEIGKVDKAHAANFRQLDPLWFKSAISFYELVGIMNRLDRVSLDPAHCGELRFVYRLAYHTKEKGEIYSRLPMTVLVKYAVTRDPQANFEAEKSNYLALSSEDRIKRNNSSSEWSKCRRFAESWVYPNDRTSDPQAVVDWMVTEKGPIGPHLLRVGEFKGIETNVQVVRAPAGERTNLAGHAVYLLRVFKKSGSSLAPDVLENTFDVAKLKKDPKLKQKLSAFLSNKDNFTRLDRGILDLPTEFLATRALSFSPFGVSRLDNRQMEQVFTKAEITNMFSKLVKSSKKPALNYVTKPFARTPEAAARRVNDMSCVGCHQGRATAGFHFLGIDRASTHPMNALIFEGSGHFEIELKRREKYLAHVLKHSQGSPGRDYSIAPPKDEETGQIQRAGFAHFCGLPGSGFAHWQCEDGLVCQQTDEAVDEKELGKCFPKDQMAGDPCHYGRVSQAEHRLDQLENVKKLNCGDKTADYSCSPLSLGHPGGTCTTTTEKQCKTSASREICGFFADTGFNNCVKEMLAGRKTFIECADGFKGVGRRGKCNEKSACRNDYVCVRTGKYDPVKRDGACAPSYFLFQVRLDGHPSAALGR